MSAYKAIHDPGIPVGIIYKDPDSKPLHERQDEVRSKARQMTLEKMLDGFKV